MSDFCVKKSKLTDVANGISAAMLIGSYTFCVCAAVGLGKWSMLICSLICCVASIGNKNKIFAPSTALLVPVLIIIGQASAATLALSIALGSLLFLLMKKGKTSISITPVVKGGVGLGIALVATILLTNLYFGIGASGAEAFEMLKSYRYLGFHPNFRGLLYGTTTLFAMITYPFKFKKLNKHIPASFITLAVPFLLNLILNPVAELTTINEIPTVANGVFPLSSLVSFDKIKIIPLLEGIISTAFLLYLNCAEEKKIRPAITNVSTGLLSGMPVQEHPCAGFSPLSAVVCYALCVVAFGFFPEILSRIPMHCVGAMLIVSVWQNVPYKSLSEAFGKKKISSLIFVVLICIGCIFYVYSVLLLCFCCSTWKKEAENAKE